jgi:hypothetical protein
MEQSPWEANSHSASQEIPWLPCSQDSATGPYPNLDASSPYFPTLFPLDPF